MKRVEKLAEAYAGQPADIVWYNRVPLDGRVLALSAFEAGYRAALEDAAKALDESWSQSDNQYGLSPEDIRALADAEEEAFTAQEDGLYRVSNGQVEYACERCHKAWPSFESFHDHQCVQP